MDIIKVPPLTFVIGNSTYEVLPTQLIDRCIQMMDEDGKTVFGCLLRVTSSVEFNLLGIPFFFGHYVAFDRDQGLIGRKALTRHLSQNH